MRAAVIAEVLGAAAIAVGLGEIYAPLAWLWAGLACFGLSYALAARNGHDDAEPPAAAAGHVEDSQG